jgi:hypothetical protein
VRVNLETNAAIFLQQKETAISVNILAVNFGAPITISGRNI